MGSDTLALRNVGPIREAHVRFGDLTVLVGPQATGKSVFLQFLKLMLDAGPIFRSLKRYGLDWNKQWSDFFDVYFGEGMKGIWDEKRSQLSWRGDRVDIGKFVRSQRKGKAEEKSFFIPAQRVLALSRDGWLRPFTDYKAGDPFTVRDFSEKLRVLMESGVGRAEAIFPQRGRLKGEIRKLLNQAVFLDFHLRVDKQGPQKRLVLSGDGRESTVPFMVWSAGQREFVPLLLGLYWLMPPTKVQRRGSMDWVIIEELEMGLHSKAITVMLLIVLDLLWRGYRVCLSTHSPDVLELVWALRLFRDHGAEPQKLMKLLGAKTQQLREVCQVALTKAAKVYFFDGETRTARDISSLDPDSQRVWEASWGGLAEFSGRATDLVASAVARGGADDI